MERSNHNLSGHGKSAAQMIKELRASNAKLSAKTADMEAEFMNQMNEATMQFQISQKKLEDSLQAKEQQIATLESRRVSAESRIRERDNDVAKLKEEVTFQRHTIADLKNQLYQLQHEIEDAEYDKRDEVDKWSAEKVEMQREIDRLQQMVNKPEREEQRGAEIMQSWKQLEEAQESLEEYRKRLHETQSELAVLENENKRAANDHKAELAILKAKHSEARSEWSIRETELSHQISDLRANGGGDNKKLSETQKQLNEKVVSLTDEKNRMAEELAKVKTDSQAQEKYREDEVQDLRVLYDAQKDELETLREDVDSLGRELAEKDESLREKSAEIEALTKQMEGLPSGDRGVDDAATTNTGSESPDQALVDELNHELEQSRAKMASLQEELRSVQDDYGHQLSASEQQIADLRNELQSMDEKMDKLRQERDDAIQDSEDNIQSQAREVETRSAQRLRDVVAKAARERADLEASYTEKVQNLQQELDKKTAEGIETDEVKQMREELITLRVTHEEYRKKMSTLQTENHQRKEELIRVGKKLEEAERAKDSVYDSAIDTLQSKVKALEAKKASADKAKKQLREAQIALVAIDDEKKRLATNHNKQYAALERDHHELRKRLDAISSEHETELKRSRATIESEFAARVSQLTTENEALLREINTVQSRAIEEANDKELMTELEKAKEAERKLSSSLSALKAEKEAVESRLKEKLEDRDTTISALVKSSVSQEQKLAALRKDLREASSHGHGGSSNGEIESRELAAVHNARNAEYIEELDNLKVALEGHKDVEQTLRQELNVTQQCLADAREEADLLRQKVSAAEAASKSSPSSFELEEFQEKLQERDAAIANLVKQSMAQEEVVVKLRQELTKQKENQSPDGPGGGIQSQWTELRRLQKESEIFASQIIEQDQEIGDLNNDLADRDEKIDNLEREILALRRRGSARDRNEVADLKAQVDELQEANDTQRTEVRELRKQLRDAKAAADESLDLRAELDQANHALADMRARVERMRDDDVGLRRERDFAMSEKDSAEQRLSQQLESVRRLRNAAVESLEEKLRVRQEEVDTVREELSSRERKIASLETDLSKIQQKLDVQSSVAEDSQKALKELRNVLETERASSAAAAARSPSADPETEEEKAALKAEIAELKKSLQNVSEDGFLVEDLQQKLDEADRIRETSEQSLVDSYERKIEVLKLNKDVTIDQLRKELTGARSQGRDELDELQARLKAVEIENRDLKDHYESTLQQKETKVHALEQTLGAQEQLVDSMRSEMDHLQSGMERSSLNRRAEIEEMQQEMMDTASKSQRLEREITALKMALEESRLEHQTEASKLKDIIASLERTPMKVAVAEHHTERLKEVKERLENMKWRNTSLQEENLKLRGRLEKAENELKSSRNDKYRTSALEDEINALQDKIDELEHEKLMMASVPSPARRVPMPPPSSSAGGGSGGSGSGSGRGRPGRSDSKGRLKSPSPNRKMSLPSGNSRRTQASPGRMRFGFGRRSNSRDPSLPNKRDDPKHVF